MRRTTDVKPIRLINLTFAQFYSTWAALMQKKKRVIFELNAHLIKIRKGFSNTCVYIK